VWEEGVWEGRRVERVIVRKGKEGRTQQQQIQ